MNNNNKKLGRNCINKKNFENYKEFRDILDDYSKKPNQSKENKEKDKCLNYKGKRFPDYKNWYRKIPIDRNRSCVDLKGNCNYESMGKVKVANAIIIIEFMFRKKLYFFHPDIVKLNAEERVELSNSISRELLIKAKRSEGRLPYAFQPNPGFEGFPRAKIEYYGVGNESYNARRKIKEKKIEIENIKAGEDQYKYEITKKGIEFLQNISKKFSNTIKENKSADKIRV